MRVLRNLTWSLQLQAELCSRGCMEAHAAAAAQLAGFRSTQDFIGSLRVLIIVQLAHNSMLQGLRAHLGKQGPQAGALPESAEDSDASSEDSELGQGGMDPEGSHSKAGRGQGVVQMDYHLNRRHNAVRCPAQPARVHAALLRLKWPGLAATVHLQCTHR